MWRRFESEIKKKRVKLLQLRDLSLVLTLFQIWESENFSSLSFTFPKIFNPWSKRVSSWAISYHCSESAELVCPSLHFVESGSLVICSRHVSIFDSSSCDDASWSLWPQVQSYDKIFQLARKINLIFTEWEFRLVSHRKF